MLKIIIYKDQDDYLYETSKKEFLSYKSIDCSNVDFDFFIKQSIPSLFFKNENKIFYNLNKLDSNKLLELILLDSSNNIYAFNKIDKRTKIYKRLLKDFKIIECEPLKGLIAKKDFIKTILLENNVNLTFLDYFIDYLPENKMIILKEIQKFKEILENTNNIDLAKKSILVYQANYDIFELINSLFEQSYKKYYSYLNKVLIDCNSYQITALLLKKLTYFINLKFNNIIEARRLIPTSDYFLNKDIRYIKNINLDIILELYKYVEKELDLYSTKDLQVRLLSIYRFFSLKLSY